MRTELRAIAICEFWQTAMELVELSYTLARKLPNSERFRLVIQLQRAAVSVAANIAEGHGRRHLGDKLHHLSISNGSLKEVETLLLISQRLEHLAAKDVDPALELSDSLGRMPTVLRQRLEIRKK